MILLSVGCGDQRFPSPWLNVDDLYNHFPEGHRERPLLLGRLQAEGNYLNFDISQPWSIGDNEVDGVLISHVCEHFTVAGALHILREAYRCLKPGGVLRVAVPDASYFRAVHAEDRRENWVRLFEDANDVSENQTYMGVALFFVQHLQVYTEDALWCQMVQAGFAADGVRRVDPNTTTYGTEAGQRLAAADNRPKFSLFMEAIRT